MIFITKVGIDGFEGGLAISTLALRVLKSCVFPLTKGKDLLY